jgi:hypothetical protein
MALPARSELGIQGGQDVTDTSPSVLPDSETVQTAESRTSARKRRRGSRKRVTLYVPPRVSVPVPDGPGLLSLLTAGLATEWAGPRTQSMPKAIWAGLALFIMLGVAVGLFGLSFFGLFGGAVAERLSVDYSVDPDKGTPTPWWIPYSVLGLGAVFVLVSLTIALAQLHQAGTQAVWARRRRDPAPWISDYPWDQEGTAPDYAPEYVRIAGSVVLSAIAVAFIAAMTAAWVYVLARPSPPPLWGWLVIGIFDVVGILMVVGAAYAVVRRLLLAGRVGRVRVQWHTFPSCTGGTLRSTVVLQRPVEATGTIRATLRCVQDVVETHYVNHTRSGRVIGTRTQETLTPHALYSETRRMAPDRNARSSFDIEFNVPSDLPGTGLVSREAIYWQIVLSAPLWGPDLDATFLAPVYEPGIVPLELRTSP